MYCTWNTQLKWYFWPTFHISLPASRFDLLWINGCSVWWHNKQLSPKSKATASYCKKTSSDGGGLHEQLLQSILKIFVADAVVMNTDMILEGVLKRLQELHTTWPFFVLLCASPWPPGYIQRKALPSSSAWTLPAGVSSPPHFSTSSRDGPSLRVSKNSIQRTADINTLSCSLATYYFE